jgi:hypothetical protein
MELDIYPIPDRPSSDFWIPGERLDDEYPEATYDELVEELSLNSGEIYIPTWSMLGAIRLPKESETIRGVVSVDLCEVIRRTAFATSQTAGITYLDNIYWKGMWKDERFETYSTYHLNTIEPIVQTVMNHGLVPPVEGIEEIFDTMRSWRDKGIYCVANTSTLEGCELATIRFLDTYLPFCFDGIVFPRNHHGSHSVTKADALGSVMQQLKDWNQAPEFALHVDDAEHHIQDMINKPPHERSHFFAPAYPGNIALAALSAHVTRLETPLEVFRGMDAYIQEALT